MVDEYKYLTLAKGAKNSGKHSLTVGTGHRRIQENILATGPVRMLGETRSFHQLCHFAFAFLDGRLKEEEKLE